MTEPLAVTIGLEVHVQLALANKLFSTAPLGFGGEPNSRVAAHDLGLPGVLPVLNPRALDLALRAALALGSTIASRTSFVRKHYFYPDLPKGYQISQLDEPFCHGGSVPLDSSRDAKIHHIHLEEDAGKTIHSGDKSTIDLNRAGTALIEIVGEPDLKTPAEARTFLEHLKQILQYAGVSDCDMEKGSLRCDANISLRPADQPTLGTKVEIKNLNSFRMVARALEHEIERQTASLRRGETITQETRGFDDSRGQTTPLRTKTDTPDYRFLVEPDLPPLIISKARIAAVEKQMPELPAARVARFHEQFQLDAYTTEVLTQNRATGDYFEALAKACGDATTASAWVQGEVLRAAKAKDRSLTDFPLSPDRLAGLLDAVAQKVVSLQAAKKVFAYMLSHPDDALSSITELGLGLIRDRDQLQCLVNSVLSQNPAAVADYRAGKQKALHALKGQCMRKSSGRADPQILETLLRTKLGG